MELDSTAHNAKEQSIEIIPLVIDPTQECLVFKSSKSFKPVRKSLLKSRRGGSRPLDTSFTGMTSAKAYASCETTWRGVCGSLCCHNVSTQMPSWCVAWLANPRGGGLDCMQSACLRYHHGSNPVPSRTILCSRL